MLPQNTQCAFHLAQIRQAAGEHRVELVAWKCTRKFEGRDTGGEISCCHPSAISAIFVACSPRAYHAFHASSDLVSELALVIWKPDCLLLVCLAWQCTAG